MHEAQGGGFDSEAEALFVTHCAEDTGGVVDKAGRVQDSDDALLQVGLASNGVEQEVLGVAGEAQCHGVDGKITPPQVVMHIGGCNLRQCTGLGVGLATCGGEVEPEAGELDGGGAEPAMANQTAAQFLRYGESEV